MNYNITVKQVTGREEMNDACSATIGKEGHPDLLSMLQAGHSPIREYEYIINCDIPTYVATHLVRHAATGQRPYVQSMRDDRGGKILQGTGMTVDRNTVVHFRWRINAQHIIDISRKRLCNQCDKQTIIVWKLILQELYKLTPELSKVCMPECEFRGNVCWEYKSCGLYPKGE